MNLYALGSRETKQALKSISKQCCNKEHYLRLITLKSFNYLCKLVLRYFADFTENPILDTLGAKRVSLDAQLTKETLLGSRNGLRVGTSITIKNMGYPPLERLYKLTLRYSHYRANR